jgi:hypothetical protein
LLLAGIRQHLQGQMQRGGVTDLLEEEGSAWLNTEIRNVEDFMSVIRFL